MFLRCGFTPPTSGRCVEIPHPISKASSPGSAREEYPLRSPKRNPLSSDQVNGDDEIMATSRKSGEGRYGSLHSLYEGPINRPLLAGCRRPSDEIARLSTVRS